MSNVPVRCEQGIKRAWIGTEPGNIASQHGIIRAGFSLIVHMTYVGRPGSGHFVIYPHDGVPESAVHDAMRTLHGRLAD